MLPCPPYSLATRPLSRSGLQGIKEGKEKFEPTLTLLWWALPFCLGLHHPREPREVAPIRQLRGLMLGEYNPAAPELHPALIPESGGLTPATTGSAPLLVPCTRILQRCVLRQFLPRFSPRCSLCAGDLTRLAAGLGTCSSLVFLLRSLPLCLSPSYNDWKESL